HLLAKRFVDRAERIPGGCIVCAVIDRVDAGQRIAVRDGVVQPRRSKILSNDLQRVAISQPDSASERRPVLHRPKRQQLLRLRRNSNVHERSIRVLNQAVSCMVVRNQSHIAQAQMLSESLIISEQKRLVFLNGPSKRASEFISLELRDVPDVEKIPSV